MSTKTSDAGGYGYGYGANPRVSSIQYQWQTQHPTFKAIQEHASVKAYLSKYPLVRSLVGDPALLLPEATPSLWHDKPSLIDYVQLPFYLWIPDWFLPHLVHHVPCPQYSEEKDSDGKFIACDGVTARRRWRSGGPRVIHDTHCSMYMHCWDYVCKKHPNNPFPGWDSRSISRMHPTARAAFKFVLSGHEGVTSELHTLIINSRMNGSSFQSLYEQLLQNRYNRLYRTIAAYYRHQEDYRATRYRSPFRSWMPGFGTAEEDSDILPMLPILHNRDGYFDHLPLSKQTISTMYRDYCHDYIPSWSLYTQQLTADLVSLDATFKIAFKLQNSSLTRLWTLIDIQTGCILHLQMLTHETHNDILPMLISYRARCEALKRPLPARVCSDRGVMDAAVLQDPRAFPDAHINVDNWHFVQLFAKTLNKKNPLFKEAKQAFSNALYQSLPNEDRQQVRTHAEPTAIIKAVTQIIDDYSHSGSQDAVITNDTHMWWNKQTGPIINKRICSNPRASSTAMPTVSSSFQENYHRQLNRRIKVVKMGEDTMHGFLLHHMYRWNIARRRKAQKEHDWHTYDLDLVHEAFDAVVRVRGRSSTGWEHDYTPPIPIKVVEHFGILHDHVTLTDKMNKASDTFPFLNTLIELIVSRHAATIPLHNVLPKAQSTIDHFITKTPRLISAPGDVNPSASLSLDAEDVPSASSATRGILPPCQRLTFTELSLLHSLIQQDTMIEKFITNDQWELAASRWNSFLKQANESYADFKGLHLATGEIIEKAVKSLENREEVDIERKMVQEQRKHPEIDYKVVSAAEAKFTEYEKHSLIQLVSRNTNQHSVSGKPRINWNQVNLRWQMQYTAEISVDQKNHLHPRLKDVLKTQYLNVRQLVDGTGARVNKRKKPDNAEEKGSNGLALVIEEKDGDAAAVSPQSNALVSASSSIPLLTFKTGESNKWSKAASERFEELYRQYNGKWTYKQFSSDWPSEDLGVVDNHRWANKNRNMRDKEARIAKEASSKKQRTEESNELIILAQNTI